MRVFWALAVVYAATCVWAVSVLPSRVPTHWSGTGGPDSWSSRTTTAVMFAVLGVVMVGIFGGLLGYLPRSRTLAGINLPHKDFWARPENLERARTMLVQDVGLVSSAVMAVLCVMPVSIVQASRTAGHQLPTWSQVVIVLLLVGVVGHVTWLTLMRWKPRPPR